MRRSSYVLTIILLLLQGYSVSSCRKKIMEAGELEEYIVQEKNGLIKTITEENVTIQAIFRPSDLLVYQELRKKENPDESDVQAARNKYGQNIYILVNIIRDGKDPLYSSGKEQEYAEALKQLAFRMSDQAFLLVGKDTLMASDYNFSPMYNMSGAVSVMFAFKKVEMKSIDPIVFELGQTLMAKGYMSFRFERNSIESIPEVKMDFLKD